MPAIDANRPYNELPELPPLVELETKRTLKKAIAANLALAELKTASELIPNPLVLLRGIVLQEARLSSEIENIVTTNDELYRAFSEDNERADPATKEVLRYQDALWEGYEHLNGGGLLTPSLFIKLAKTVKQADLDVRKGAGTRLTTSRTGQAVYAPPEGEQRLRNLLRNLCQYMNAEDDVDPLIKMAVTHYQFEAIHPFPDGNGRTGRILNILFLVDQGLLDLPVLYLSRYIIERKSAYYEGLRLVTEDAEWEPWILFMLEGVEQTARDTKRRISDIRTAMSEAVERARKEMSKGYSKELIELVFQQPYTRIASLESAGIAKRDAASEYLRDLERIGILESTKKGRDVLYLNRQLLTILSAA